MAALGDAERVQDAIVFLRNGVRELEQIKRVPESLGFLYVKLAKKLLEG